MITMIGGIKGGTGKTTIATNLAVMRSASKNKVLLIDADEQKTTVIWSNQRDSREVETNFTTVPLGGKALRTQLEKMKGDYDDIIIDVGGRETTSLRAAITISDVWLIPFRPRSPDIWAIDDISSVIVDMKPTNQKIKIFSILNQADFSGSDNESSLSILQDCEEFDCIEFTIGMRKSFPNAFTDGLGVIEMKIPDKKAVHEIKSLYDFVYNKCRSIV